MSARIQYLLLGLAHSPHKVALPFWTIAWMNLFSMTVHSIVKTIDEWVYFCGSVCITLQNVNLEMKEIGVRTWYTFMELFLNGKMFIGVTWRSDFVARYDSLQSQ